MRCLFLAALAPSLALLPSTAIAEAPAADPQKQVCKSESREGSRVMKRVCRTRAEWDAIAEQNKRALAESRDQPKMNPVGCGGTRPC